MGLKETYNRIAEDWATDHAADTWWIEGTDKFCSFLEPGASVMDVGCGAGLKTKFLSDRGFQARGSDFAPKMIEAAKRKYPGLRFFSYYKTEELEACFARIGMTVIWKTVTFSGRTNWIQMVAKKPLSSERFAS